MISIPRLSLCVVAFAGVALSTARAQLIAYEPFNYTVGGNVAGNTLSGVGAWSALNTGTAPSILSGNLNVTGLQDSAGASVSLPGGNYQEAVLALPSSNTSGSLFFSIALSLTGAPGAATATIGFANSGTNLGGMVFTQAATGGYQIGFSIRSSGTTVTYDPTIYSTGSTIFLVGRYDFVAGGTGNDTGALWINPSQATFGAGAAPTATITSASTGTSDLGSITQFILRGVANSPIAVVDELRIGTTWASVTPAAIPEPSTYAALLGALALGLVALRRHRRNFVL